MEKENCKHDWEVWTVEEPYNPFMDTKIYTEAKCRKCGKEFSNKKLRDN